MDNNTIYDVVVVGSGLAGLAAALQCQLNGKKTLLIEKHNLPGGCATSFVRGRFEFEPSLHELCDYGTKDHPGEIARMFEEFGVKLNWVEVPDCFRSISKYKDGTKMDITLPAGLDAYKKALVSYCPEAKDKVDDLFTLLDEIVAGINYTTEMKGHPDTNVMMTKYANMLRTGAYSTTKVFKALKLPQKVRDILSIYWGYLGVDLDHLAFIHYAAMVHKYVSMGAVIPAHTSHELSSAMVERFRELGGEVWFNCKANKFLFEGDRICGVDTNMGVIKTKYVLANINPDIIYGHMMPKELIPTREKKLSNARKQKFGARIFVAYFGLDCTAESLGIKDYNTFLAKGSDSVKEYNSITKGIDENEFSILLCPNIINPKCSPEGTCIVTLTTMGAKSDYDDLTMENYPKMKEKYVDKLLKGLKEKMGIDISGHIEEYAVASPWTFARYLNVPEGAVYGYETRGWDGMMARMQSLDLDYPIKGLRPIGAAGPRGDGYSSAMICGKLIARLAIKDLNDEGGNK